MSGEHDETIAADEAANERLADAETRLAECYEVLKAVARRHRHCPGEPAGAAKELLSSHGIDWAEGKR